jgi:hypothetical protein
MSLPEGAVLGNYQILGKLGEAPAEPCVTGTPQGCGEDALCYVEEWVQGRRSGPCVRLSPDRIVITLLETSAG